MLFHRARASEPVTSEPTDGVRRWRRRGTSAVEFAVVAPVYLMVVLGIIELGRGLMVSMLLFNAARVGARVGTIEGTSTANINTAVNNYLSGAGMSTQSVVVDVNDNLQDASTAVAGDEITVVVSIQASQVTWVPGVKLVGFLSNSSGKDTTISGNFTLRRE
jgi:Flp pilus assembly protein TadG